MSGIIGHQIEPENLSFSERALNYAFMKEFLLLEDSENDWIAWVSTQLGYETPQTLELLIEKLDKLTATALTSHRFGI